MAFTTYFERFKKVLGGLVSTADPTGLVQGQAAALRLNEKAHLMVDIASSTSTGAAVDIQKIDGSDPASAGLAGVLAVGGTGADAAAPTGAYSVRVAGIVRNILTTLTDTYKQSLLVDLYGRLHTRSASFDQVSAADRVSANTIADDRDESSQVWGSITDDATDPDYFPSTAGYEVGNRTWLTFHLRIRDGVVTFEESNDGTNWKDVTLSIEDRAAGGGSGVASFRETDVATADFILETKVGSRYIRCKWDPNNATSIFQLYTMARVA